MVERFVIVNGKRYGLVEGHPEKTGSYTAYLEGYKAGIEKGLEIAARTK